MSQNYDALDCFVRLLDDHIEVKFEEHESPLKLNNFWLRENCRCSKCYSHILNQRNINILDIPESIRPVSVKHSDNSLLITWNNNEHVSVYPVEWLIGQLHLEILPEPILWYGDISSAVTITESDLRIESKLADLVKSLLIYGVGFVEDVEPTIEATEKVVTSLFPIQRTFFGDMWEFSNKMDHFDSAYTNVSLCAHNDNTYFNDAAGLQVFHLLEHNGSGGETLLVDGFRAVKDVRLENPKFIDCLRNVSVESVYLDPSRHITYFSPILHFHPNNQLKQIRFNLLDRSARMPMPTSEVGLFYKSLRCLAAKINEKDGESWVKLRPGTVAFINNWRVLHGRASYNGYRRMGGCYVAMGELLSKARILKLIF